MIFHTASSIPRPIRLKESTRKWAYESMHGKYGDEAMSHPRVHMDDIENFDSYSNVGKYDLCIKRIAEQAPIRICDEERICGAATLGAGMQHVVPADLDGGILYRSVSHLTIRYDRVIREGMTVYETEVAERLKDESLDEEQIEFLHSLENALEAIRIWHGRYLEATEKTRPDLHALLQRVPYAPARNFHEALQALWFTFAFVRLCGNWPGIGRIDLLLGDYLKRDLESGAIDLDEARELLASFFIKGCEWIRSNPGPSSGDAQHYQNIILAGIDEDGAEVTNEVTYLVLDIVEELAISDFPITVRLNENTAPELKEKIARVMRHGGGIVAVYNEPLILRALSNLGYPEREARTFANDGCWEVQIPGKTDFGYMPFDALQIFNDVIGITGDKIPDFSSAEEVYAAFCERLNEDVQTYRRHYLTDVFVNRDGKWRSVNVVCPTSVVSIFEDGCIESARSYYDLGPKYVVRSPHIGGAPDVANSIYAIEKLVFEDKKISFPELVQCLKDNWEGNEMLRLYVKNNYVYYGNDSDEADRWHSRLLDDFADMVTAADKSSYHPSKYIPGVSTFGRQVGWLPNRCATAFGYRKGDILSGNDSPVPGTDTCGATAIIKSYCKSDLVKQSCGAALDIKLYPSSLDGDNGTAALIGLMDGFLALGGFFMQLDTVDVQTLIEAQKDPQKYKTLSVRVSGWNARFVTLEKEWQRMIIERNSQNPS